MQLATLDLLAFGRKQVLRPSVVDVHEALHRLLPMLKRLVGEHIQVALSLGQRPLHALASFQRRSPFGSSWQPQLCTGPRTFCGAC